MTMRFYVNIDHVATVRQARRTDEPDPVRVAVLVELAGANGITVHLREDRRHIQDRDVRLLMSTVRTVVNLELAATSQILDIACELGPFQATLVPEEREEITTEGGLDLSTAERRTQTGAALDRLAGVGTRTALFIDPDEGGIRASVDLGADAVELHTGEYANTRAARPGGRARAPAGGGGTRRARAHLRERHSRGRHTRDRGAQHRPQRDLPRRPGRDGAGGS
jgi:pyridoxine 5-phosphate synthase